ncbi:MAG: ACT domain-containing protein [Pseudonocardiaceae bacterium]
MSFLIRIQLPDRPGALGAVATALGKVGCDILSLDVVERRSGIAIDDLVVELPAGRLPDVLITAAESVEGVEVDAVRPWAGVLDTHRELELIEQVAADPAGGLQIFTNGVPKITRAGWAVVLTSTAGRPHRVAGSSAAPETQAMQLPWWPLRRATILDGEDAWVPLPWRELGTELAATPLGGAELVLLVGRPGGPTFRAAELARLEHLAGIVAVLLRKSS